ncbi:hypothetical protein XBJ1_4325 [Xenorhabdus bovienii SS-2004]|uniref:Uncharacterized protein n=1 Tax=Xenorhabdus bovienii (strain SS-2004) TaxID=406818 RepID=D3V6Z9_XENBS|nr:hypothetical protein XBJ1_4325 [Xenorhabdus bovienii SS-2004]
MAWINISCNTFEKLINFIRSINCDAYTWSICSYSNVDFTQKE